MAIRRLLATTTPCLRKRKQLPQPRVMRKASTVQFRRRPGWRAPAIISFATLVLSGCARKAPQDTFTPEGPAARDITRLARPVFAISIGMGIFVYALVIFCIIKFRRKGEDHVPKQVHGNTKLELFWGAVPAMMLAGVGVFSTAAIIKQHEEPKNAYNITVVGHQWWWEYHYPQVGQEKLAPKLVTMANPADVDTAKAEGRNPKNIGNVVQEAGKVVVGANELHVPAGRNVRLLITSEDVMHNYWVPKLAGKIYAIPGRINKLTLNTDANDAGKTIYGQCAEFCGTSHANMRFKVKVDSPADFQKWLTEQTAPAAAPTSDMAKAGEVLFNGSGGCTACHWVDSSKTNSYEKDASGAETLKIGPNLSHVGSRKHFAGAIAELNERNLKAWLRNPQVFKPGSKMVIRKLNEDEVNKLVAYILSLK